MTIPRVKKEPSQALTYQGDAREGLKHTAPGEASLHGQPTGELGRLSTKANTLRSDAPGRREGERGPLRGAAARRQQGEAAGASLPCLSENNSIRGVLCCGADGPSFPDPFAPEAPKYSSQQRKQFTSLVENIEYAVNLYGKDRVGFLTLTFKPEFDRYGNLIHKHWSEVSRRFNSLATNSLRGLFVTYLSVKEPHLGNGLMHGELHFHLLVVTKEPISCDNDQVQAGNYSSANDHLRGLWAELRVRCESHNFGIHHLLPVRRNGEAIARYLAKYLAKTFGDKEQFPQLRGSRLLNYARNWPRRAWPCFSWVGEGGTQWRAFLRHVAHQNGIASIDQMQEGGWGRSWGYRLGKLFTVWKGQDPDTRLDVSLPTSVNLVAAKRLGNNRHRLYAHKQHTAVLVGRILERVRAQLPELQERRRQRMVSVYANHNGEGLGGLVPPPLINTSLAL